MTTSTSPSPSISISTLVPHLTVQDANAALAFYTTAFGAKELTRSHAPNGKITHATLRFGDSTLFLSDHFGGPPPTPASVTLNLNTDDADALFAQALNAGAEVAMPLMDAFWGDRYGQLRDPFGHTWAVATHQHDYTPEQIEQKSKEFFSKFSD